MENRDRDQGSGVGVQPSTFDREEFFSGEAVYPPEPSPSHLTGSSSAPGGGRKPAGAHDGGSGGSCPLPAPAPGETAAGTEGLRDSGTAPMRIREASEAMGIEDEGCLLRLSPRGILALKQDREMADRRNALIIRLLFAARELALGELIREGDSRYCMACYTEDGHHRDCRAAAVLAILDELRETAPDASKLGGESASQQVSGAVDQADGAQGGAQ